jgi:multidrug resistance efflux pump
MLAIGFGVGYWIYDNYTFYRTDDVQVTGPIVSVSAPTAGQVASLMVKLGDSVTAGQTVATLSTTTASSTTNTVNVTSPISGIILQTPVVQGQLVTPGLAIAQVTDLKSITVTAYVDEGAIDRVKVGQDVDIHIDAYGDTSYTGKVQQIVQATAGQFSLLPTQDNASGNFTKVGQRIPIVISLDGLGSKDIVPGMSAEATIHIH